MGEENGKLIVTSLEELRGLNQKNVQLPEARTEKGERVVVTIRKLIGLDFLGMGSLPPAIMNEPDAEKRVAHVKKQWEDPARQEALTKTLVCRGVISHKVVDVHPKDCPQDSVTPYAIGTRNDIIWLAAEIQTFSGLDQEAAQVSPGFPEKSGTGITS